MKERKILITIRTDFGDRQVKVRGFRINKFLAVTEAHLTHGRPYGKYRWKITHIPTGFCINSEDLYEAGGLLKSDALNKAKALTILDWDFYNPDSRKVKLMKNKVRKILSKESE